MDVGLKVVHRKCTTFNLDLYPTSRKTEQRQIATVGFCLPRDDRFKPDSAVESGLNFFKLL